MKMGIFKLFVLVIVTSFIPVVSGQAAGVACGANNVCNTDLVCDANICKLNVGGNCSGTNAGNCKTGTTCDNNVCKYKAGQTCAVGVDKCVTGATCTGISAPCTCDASKYTTVDGMCKLNAGGDCSGTNSGNCKTGTTCDNNVCRLNPGVDCSGANSGNCKTGTICDSTCKYKAGQICTEGVTRCVDGASCTAVTANCTCDVSKYVVSDSICKLKVDQTCTTSGGAPCINNADCTSTVCKCKTSYTANADKTACSNASGLMSSVLLLLLVFIASRTA